jgi:hypothetical protein
VAETDHVHEKGTYPEPVAAYVGFHACRICIVLHSSSWWDGYEQAIADVQAHGLPDHEERMEVAGQAVREMGQFIHPLDLNRAVRAYHAWTKEK